MAGGILINAGTLMKLVEGGDLSVNALQQLILAGAYTASPSIATMNYIWNSDQVGDLLGTLIPEQKELFITLKTLDDVLANETARGLVINNPGVIETLMSQFGIKNRFIKNIDIVIEMLKSSVAKDFILSDKEAVNEILNSPEDFNKFFTAFKADETMRFNILNSDYPYLKEKMNSNQDVLTYYMNYGSNNDYKTFNQIFSDVNALKNAAVKNGLQYSYLEFCFILQNMEFFKYICDTGIVDGYIKGSDERICALICNIKETADLVFANEAFCTRLYANDKMFEKILLSKIACDSLCNSEVALTKLLRSESLYNKFLQSKIAEDSLFSSELGSKKAFAVEGLRTRFFTSANIKQYERMLEYKGACDAMFQTKEVCDIIFANEDLFVRVLERELPYTSLFSHKVGCDTVFGISTVYNKIFANEDLCTTLFKSQVACDSLYALPETLGIVFINNLPSCCLFASEIACDRLFLLSAMCTKLFENSVAYNNLYKSPMAYNKMFDNRIACTALYANTNAADNLLFNTNIKDLAFNNEVSADCLLSSNVSNIKVFTSSKLSNILASSEISLDLLFSKSAVFTKACGQKIACDKLFDSPISTKKIFLRTDLCDIIFKSAISCDSMFANLETCENLFNSRVACDTLFANKLAYDKVFANKAVCDIMFASEVAIDSLFASDLAFAAVLLSTNASDCMFNSSLASEKIFQSGTITDKVYASVPATSRLFINSVGCISLFNSEAAYNKIISNDTLLTKALANNMFIKTMVDSSKNIQNSIEKIYANSNYTDLFLKGNLSTIRPILSNEEYNKILVSHKSSCMNTLKYANVLDITLRSETIYNFYFNIKENFMSILSNDSYTNNLMQANTALQSIVKKLYTSSKKLLRSLGTWNEDGVANLNSRTSQQYCIAFACLGTYSSRGNQAILKHRNGRQAAASDQYVRPTNVTETNVNAVSFSRCTFEESGDAHAAVQVFN